jgi:sugar lactone lactonase YvrE
MPDASRQVDGALDAATPPPTVTTLATGFDFPFGLAVDSDGNVWVADESNHVVREISPTGGAMTTVTGFNLPTGVAIDSGDNVYVVDYGNNTICKVLGGSAETIAGLAGNPGSSDGSGSGARFNQPIGLSVDAAGTTIYVADSGNNAIRTVTPSGIVSTLTGSTAIQGTAVDSDGNIYAVGDDAIGKNSELLAGMVGTPGFSNGSGATASFNDPQGIAVDIQGNVYVADSDNVIVREITPTGFVSTLAGDPGVGGDVNGVGSAARFGQPRGVAVGSGHVIYVADSSNNAIRRITQ